MLGIFYESFATIAMKFLLNKRTSVLLISLIKYILAGPIINSIHVILILNLLHHEAENSTRVSFADDYFMASVPISRDVGSSESCATDSKI